MVPVMRDLPAEIGGPKESMSYLRVMKYKLDETNKVWDRRTNPRMSLTILWSENAP